jgi:hypothetical protein
MTGISILNANVYYLKQDGLQFNRRQANMWLYQKVPGLAL